MGWDEALFGHFLKKLQQRKSAPGRHGASVRLEDVAPRLRLLACAVTGESIEILEAETVGSYSGHRIHLPKEMSLTGDPKTNLNAYLYRLLYTLASRELGLALSTDIENDRHGSIPTLLAIPYVRRCLTSRYPKSDDLLADIGLSLSPLLFQDKRAMNDPWLFFVHQACSWPLPQKPDASILEASLSIMQRATSLLRDSSNFSFSMDHLAHLENSLSIGELSPLFHLFGRITRPAPVPETPTESTPPSRFSLESLSRGTERKGKARERVEEVKLGEKKENENPLIHVFEKVLTADEYNAGKKNLDGSDELEEHADALEELNLRYVIRTRDRAHSLYKSDAVLESGAPDLVEVEETSTNLHFYDEWDESNRTYRTHWCTVHVADGRDEPEGETGLADPPTRTVAQIKKDLENVLNKRRWRDRQPDGPELDLDSVINRAADLAAGHSASEKIYRSRRISERDVAMSILIDASLSTDSWVENRHVIQVAKEAVLTLAEALKTFQTEVSVAAFYSNTRRDCRFIELKRFNEDWSRVRPRLSNLRPAGYTRIGPALRHATKTLRQARSKKKLLVLISDGKPSDYDRYEGRYGIQDVRQAVREANQVGVHVRAIAIDSHAKPYLAQMFGTAGYHVLRHPGLLAPSLSKVFTQCLK